MAETTNHFVHTNSSAPVIENLFRIISNALAENEKVLWLLSGGSAISIAVSTAARLKELNNLDRLTIMQIDERYGPVGHKDSNWKAIIEAGFDCKPAKYIPVLKNLPFDETVDRVETLLKREVKSSDLRIGLFGIGPDGHTAGMLPYSSAAAEKQHLVVGYTGPDYPRITMTTPAIEQLDLAIAFASGEPKIPTIKLLVNRALPIAEQPAQALKLSLSFYLYSDYV